MTHVDYPLNIDARRRTARTGYDDHIRDLIEQVLFTAPGERVHRPTFGSGILQLVFAPNSDAMAAATEMSARASLQQWLAREIDVDDVRIETEDATLRVTVVYRVKRDDATRVAVFEREAQ